MGRFKIKFGVILATLVMVIVLSSACGPGAEPQPQPPAPPEPGGNQPPVISSLTSAQTQVYPSSIIEIECVASDPDGDAISYEWSTTGGKFSGAGPVVSWVAPEHLGNYDITVTIKDGKGGITQGTITLSVVQNRDPEILSLDASPDTVLPNDKSMITCAARDPDGDVLNYSWEASDGSITGVGDTIIWVAPDREGEFIITVIVDDGKGGQNAAHVSITVCRPIKTLTLNLLPSETGTVSSTGDKDSSKIMAVDSDKDVGYRAFFSFDISQLKGTEIKDAKLTFTTGKVFGKPFDKSTGLGGLQLYRVRGEQGQLPDYATDRDRLVKGSQVMWEPPTVIDVTPEVRSALLIPKFSVHLQFEASFRDKTNANHFADYIRWSLATLTVTYVEK